MSTLTSLLLKFEEFYMTQRDDSEARQTVHLADLSFTRFSFPVRFAWVLRWWPNGPYILCLQRTRDLFATAKFPFEFKHWRRRLSALRILTVNFDSQPNKQRTELVSFVSLYVVCLYVRHIKFQEDTVGLPVPKGFSHTKALSRTVQLTFVNIGLYEPPTKVRQ